MQISVTFRNMEPSDALKSYALEKCSRLKKYLVMPVDVQVILAKHKYRNQAEIKVTSSGAVMKCQEDTEDMYSSIDLALDKIERQARRYKDKVSKFRPAPLGSEVTIRHRIVKEGGLGEEENPMIVNLRESSAKPMSVDEAVMQMSTENNEFLVFVNSTTQDVNVVYRRRDGNIGLIEAKAPREE